MDIIVCINFIESRKYKILTLETYTGKIPKLKSKLFSGPLRKVSIDTVDMVANMTQLQLDRFKQFLRNEGNVQINKYQHLIENSNLTMLQDIFVQGAFFYRDDGKNMPLVDEIKVEVQDIEKDCQRIAGVQYECVKNDIFIVVNTGIEQNMISKEIKAVMYIDLEDKDYRARLFFEYDSFPIMYGNKQSQVEGREVYRDYCFEQGIVLFLQENDWHYQYDGYFGYKGKNISASVSAMQNKGIILYTSANKPIVQGHFINCSMNYHIDWFELKGYIQAGNNNYDLSRIIDLKNNKKSWVEVDGNTVFLPMAFKQLEFLKTGRQRKDKLEISGHDIPRALQTVYALQIERIGNIEKLFAYEDVRPEIGDKIWGKLRSYQRTGVKWLLYLYENGFGGCLADDMGLGKTFQIIAYLSDRRFTNTKSMIVVPKTLLVNWSREFEKFSAALTVCVYYGDKRNSKEIDKKRIILTTYGTVLNDLNILKQINFANLIIDEAQTIKNNRTRAYQALNRLDAETKIALTGTPLENNVRELCNLMQLINPGLFPSYEKISRQYESDDILISVIKRMCAPFLLRRMKEEVLSDMPARQERIIYCQMESCQRELYNDILSSVRYEIEREAGRFEIKSSAPVLLKGLLYLQEVCCHPALLPIELYSGRCLESAKLEVLKELLQKLNSNGHKTVVFSRFTKMLQLIEKQLKKEKYTYFYLDGKTRERQKIVDEFEQSQEGIFLISLKTGGTGLNLVSADTAIIYDPWWNPAVEKQAGDRIYRIGQKKDVTIYKLIAANTIEEKIENLQNKKMEIVTQILEGREDISGITIEELKELLLQD